MSKFFDDRGVTAGRERHGEFMFQTGGGNMDNVKPDANVPTAMEKILNKGGILGPEAKEMAQAISIMMQRMSDDNTPMSKQLQAINTFVEPSMRGLKAERSEVIGIVNQCFDQAQNEIRRTPQAPKGLTVETPKAAAAAPVKPKM